MLATQCLWFRVVQWSLRFLLTGDVRSEASNVSSRQGLTLFQEHSLYYV
jgi:hypothetical protein